HIFRQDGDKTYRANTFFSITGQLGNAVPSSDANNSYLQFSDLHYWYLPHSLPIRDIVKFSNPNREIRLSMQDLILENKATSQDEMSIRGIMKKFRESQPETAQVDEIQFVTERPDIRDAKIISKTAQTERQRIRNGAELEKTVVDGSTYERIRDGHASGAKQ